MEPWQVALGLGFTVLALGYLGRVAKEVRIPTQQLFLKTAG